MDLRDLRYFEAIADLLHVGRASARVHRSQPALTSSVRRLEAACGAALFEKAGRGIRLTEAGHVLLKWAQRLRFDVDDARREIAALHQGLAGHVRIGIVPTAAQFLLPAVARQLLHEAPAVTLATQVALVDTLRPRLRAGELDLVVGTEGPDTQGLETRALADDPVVVVAAAGHPVFEGRPRLKDLCAHGWALQPPGAPTRDWLDHSFDRHHLPRPRVQVESSMLLVLPALIAQTGLLSFVSRLHLTVGLAGAGLLEVPVKEAVMQRRLVVNWRAHSYQPPAAARVIELFAAGPARASSPRPRRAR